LVQQLVLGKAGNPVTETGNDPGTAETAVGNNPSLNSRSTGADRDAGNYAYVTEKAGNPSIDVGYTGVDGAACCA